MCVISRNVLVNIIDNPRDLDATFGAADKSIFTRKYPVFLYHIGRIFQEDESNVFYTTTDQVFLIDNNQCSIGIQVYTNTSILMNSVYYTSYEFVVFLIWLLDKL